MTTQQAVEELKVGKLRNYNNDNVSTMTIPHASVQNFTGLPGLGNTKLEQML